MKYDKVLLVAIGLLVGVVGTMLFAKNAITSNNAGVMQMMGMGRSTFNSSVINNLDKHFIEQMIPHHEGAIEMAELAKKRSQNTNILKLSDAIIQSQDEEITQMQSWYREWYGVEVPKSSTTGMGMGRGMMHGGMMGGSVSDIDALKNATDFDKAFLEEMIPHHQMAVMMAQMLLSGTDRLEMKQLAQDIIDAQESEIEQMRSWLSE